MVECCGLARWLGSELLCYRAVLPLLVLVSFRCEYSLISLCVCVCMYVCFSPLACGFHRNFCVKADSSGGGGEESREVGV